MSRNNIQKPIGQGVARVPVVMQMEALECGAASLAMILAYYGKWLPLERVRSDCGVSRDGSSAKNIALAAKRYGLSVKAYRYEPEELREKGHFPCIIHWNFNHFIVCKGFRGKYAYINDPASGDSKLSMEDFDRAFTGICLEFAPTESFEAEGKQRSMMEYALKRLKGSETAVLFVFLLTMIISLTGLLAKRRVNITRVQMRDKGKLAGETISGIEMIETIKSSGAENGFFEKWAGYQASVNTQEVRLAKMNQYLGSLPELLLKLTNVAVLLLGVRMTMQGSFTVGMVMAFQGFLQSFMEPAQNLIEAGKELQEMRTEMERVEDVMGYPKAVSTEKKSDESTEYDKLTGNLQLKNVTFGYSKLKEPLIRDFNLELKTGSRVAFVGTSGCGKSTLSKLISGLYQPWEGEILFDGKRIDEIDREVFTGSLAVVDQDIILFEDTIANNIKMWDETIEDFEMIMAARDAKLHEDIMQRNGGYNYKIMEGGKDFSGGQRQRIEIARVLAADPTIIIMDEATSALDARTEYEVVNAIKDRGITCIVVAHRLSTIRDCDEIIVMDQGVVVERGTHEELYAKGGFYTELVTSE